MTNKHSLSYTAIGKIYFWTVTIHNWYHLLLDDKLKLIITGSLKKLSDEKKISVYSFVIMPNHIHLIWKQNGFNGKETPKGSFLKYTSHMFTNHLREKGLLDNYTVDAANKKHEIWQSDAMGIEIYSKAVAIQKLNYIHNNPLQEKWKLVKRNEDYYFSSTRFYETGVDDFDFLQNIFTAFGDE